MPFENYTIKDIAKALNLSPSTISKALRDSYEISSETKRIVLEYAEKVNYRPNPIAQSLKERKSNSIGVIVSEISNTFFSQVIEGIEAVANKKGYQVIIAQTNESFERECKNLEHFYSRSVDGLIMTLSSENNNLDHLEKLVKKNYPLVFFDRVPENIDSYKVIVDNKKGSYDAVQFLIDSGKSKIAHLTGPKNLSVMRERLDGYLSCLKDNNIEYCPKLVYHCDYGNRYEQEINQALADLSNHEYDAIFISGDKLTTAYLQALNDKTDDKLNAIPIAGFTNLTVANLFSPKISMVKQPAFDMGKKAAELLIKHIESNHRVQEFETIVLPTELLTLKKR